VSELIPELSFLFLQDIIYVTLSFKSYLPLKSPELAIKASKYCDATTGYICDPFCIHKQGCKLESPLITKNSYCSQCDSASVKRTKRLYGEITATNQPSQTRKLKTAMMDFVAILKLN
jgi:hypothetical protein